MGAEARLRTRHRAAIKKLWPHAVVRGRPGNAWSGEGWPDLDVLVQGTAVSLEFKSSTGRATPVQLARIVAIRRAGGYAWVVYTPEQSVSAIRTALEKKRMPDDFGFIFDDDTAPPETANEAAARNNEIRAFLEPDIQAAVERNGHEPAGDGAAIIPPADLDLATLHSVVGALATTVNQLTNVVTEFREYVASLQVSAETTTELPPSTTTVRRSRKK